MIDLPTPSPNGVTFFIPCLNEEGNVSRAIESIRDVMVQAGGPFEIIVVDDASTDGTVSEVETCGKRYPDISIRIVRNPFCRGLGRNYFIAAQRANQGYFMLINGDAAEPPDTIRAILSHKGQADAIVPYFGLQESRTWQRRMLSALFTCLVNLLSGHRLRYYNGPVLHRTENVRQWFAETAGFGYQAELLCRLLDEGITVLEVQVRNSDRGRGASKALRLSNLFSVANSLFHIVLRRMQRGVFRLLGTSQPSSTDKKTRV